MSEPSYLEPYAMRKQCGDCAFDPTSPAGRCEITVAMAQLCVTSGEPFYCHEAGTQGGIEPRTDSRGEPVLCRGFVDAFVARGPIPDWQAAISEEALRIIDDAKDGKAVSDDEFRDRILAAGERAQIPAEDRR